MIQRATVTENPYAEKQQAWGDLIEVWAGVEYPMTKTDEEYQGPINVAQRSIIFEVRAMPMQENSVTIADRISYDGLFFDINSIEKDHLNARWKLQASSVQ